MYRPKPLEIAFLTNFSDACFRAIPSVARLVDDLAVNLTILHAYHPKTQNRFAVESTLRSFFPEADGYHNVRRLALPGNPVEVVRQMSYRSPLDLLICPASDPLGIPRPGHSPLRARFVHDCQVPVWTMGRRVDASKLGLPVRNVACWMDMGSNETAHLLFAAAYAQKQGARLHLLHSLPEINDGALLPSLTDQPLHPQDVRDAFQSLLADVAIEPEVHVQTGNGYRTRAKMAQACEADILFTQVTRSPLTDWLRPAFSAIDQCACPVICLGTGTPARQWKLATRPAAVNRARLIA